MSRLMPTLSALVLLFLASQLASAADVQKLVSHGDDGDTTYYSVYCSNGSVGSVGVSRSPRETCVAPANGRKQCRAIWKLRTAAKSACR